MLHLLSDPITGIAVAILDFREPLYYCNSAVYTFRTGGVTPAPVEKELEPI